MKEGMFLLMSLASLALAQPQHKPGGTISINSPRADEESPGENQNGENIKKVLVRLPDDLEAMLNLQKQDRSRIHASILGIDPNQGRSSADTEAADSLRDILGEGTSPNARTTPRVTIKKTPMADLVTTTATTTEAISRTTTAAPARRTLKPVVRITNPNPKSAIDRSIWSIAWEAHVYFSGTLFVLLAIYCTVNLARLHAFSRLFSRGYFVAINACVILISVIRPIYLFVDPYNEGLFWPRAGAYLLLDTGYPCLTTAFAVLFLALLRATQLELVSPSFQTPKSLGLFCLVHLLISIMVDVAIGIWVEVRYTILICQGFFIVWSLLLSAGFFYVYSPLKKIAIRSQPDYAAVYPKLMLDQNGIVYAQNQTGGLTMNSNGDPLRSMDYRQISPNPRHRPPLARAVTLTLGVAIISSIMGGVQLFGMIKMLGLQKIDMSSKRNEWAWFGYQVPMRVLEVTMCTLLAVIATTPLRSDVGGTEHENNGLSPLGGNPENRRRKQKFHHWRKLLSCSKCCLGNNPPREFEDEIYSEIGANHHSTNARQMLAMSAQQQMAAQNALNSAQAHGGGAPQFPIQFYGPNGEMVITADNPYGTLGPGGRIVMTASNGSDATLMHLGTLNSSEGVLHASSEFFQQNAHNQQQQQMMMVANNRRSATNSMSSSNPNSTLLRSEGGGTRTNGHRYPTTGSQASGRSRATVDTALYSNVRNSNASSRPSSMLFNDSGFVRFRIGNDPNMNPEDVLKKSTEDLEKAGLERRDHKRSSQQGSKLEKMRASQSFDDSVLLSEIAEPSHSSPTGSACDNRAKSEKRSASNALNNSKSQQGKVDNPLNKNQGGRLSRLSSGNNPIIGARESPIYRSIESLNFNGDRRESAGDIYEPPPGMKLPDLDTEQQNNIHSPNSQNQGIYSEDELSSVYYGRIGSSSNRPPSRCSSISATQSFDMRMYGTSRDATETKSAGKPERLENPYYYYGSTRNQKRAGNLKPRPLLPSQRAQLELKKKSSKLPSNPLFMLKRQTDKGSGIQQMNNSSRPGSRQALLQESQREGSTSSVIPAQFQRSRSLGGYYNRQGPAIPIGPGGLLPGDVPIENLPVRNQNYQLQGPQRQQAGSMTPISYSRWQHAQRQEENPVKRHNPLYDTPPTIRQAHFRLESQRQRGPINLKLHGSKQNGPNQYYQKEIRGLQIVDQRNTQPKQLVNEASLPSDSNHRFYNQDPDSMLAPPINNGPTRHAQDHNYATDDDYGEPGDCLDRRPSYDEEDDPTTYDEGCSEGGLEADNESEVSSMFEPNRGRPRERYRAPGLAKAPLAPSGQIGKPNQTAQQDKMSPLEYSAMLKLQGTQNDSMARMNAKPKPKMGLQRRVSDGKEYKSVANGDIARTEADAIVSEGNTTVFSSSSSSSSPSCSEDDQAEKSDEGADEDNEPERKTSTAVFRWDGTRIVPETEEIDGHPGDISGVTTVGNLGGATSKLANAPRPPPRSSSQTNTEFGDEEVSSDDDIDEDNDADYEETGTEDDALEDNEAEEEVFKPKANPMNVRA